MDKRIVGIVGSYRKGGTIDSAVSEILEAAQVCGARTEKIYLLDKKIEFCTNCRNCTQEPGGKRGQCIHRDDMDMILDTIEAADTVVLGAPVNVHHVNALFKRFQERLVCYVYWPWGAPSPRLRSQKKGRRAIVVTSSAMPAWVGRFNTGPLRALKTTAVTLGAKPVGSVYVGMAALQQQQPLTEKILKRCQKVGKKACR